MFEFGGFGFCSEQVSWSAAEDAGGGGAEEVVHGFERAEEAGEAGVEVGRGLASGCEVARVELIAHGDDGGPHRAVFVCSARPGYALFGIDPDSETHSSYGLFVNKTSASTGLSSRNTFTFTVSPGLWARKA